MNEDHKKAVREANQRRAISCRKCGAFGQLRERDGSEVGGMPGLKYKECGACGHAQPITKRPRREKL